MEDLSHLWDLLFQKENELQVYQTYRTWTMRKLDKIERKWKKKPQTTKTTNPNLMYLEKSLDEEKAECIWQVLKAALLPLPVVRTSAPALTSVAHSTYRSSHLLLAITYKPQPKSFTGTLRQTIFLDRYRRRRGTAITNTPKFKSKISVRGCLLFRFT